MLVPKNQQGDSLLRCISRLVPELTASSARIALEVGCVFVGKRRQKDPNLRLKAGALVTVNLGRPFEDRLSGDELPPRPLTILFEDEHLIVVNKPSGVHTVPTPEGDVGTLLWSVEQHVAQAGGARPTVVHRLDMPTSGVLCFAKGKLASQRLMDLFKAHDLVRQYDAFVHGHWPKDTTIEAPVDGRRALTHIKLQQRLSNATWLLCTLETGRTHQIRKHTSAAGHPVLADPKYGSKQPNDPPRLALHARDLAFEHPARKERMHFHVPLAPELAAWATAHA